MYKFCIDLTQTTCFSFVFLLYRLPESIGKIWKVQIWHNNVGSSPSWYLSRVIVKDLNNGQCSNHLFFLNFFLKCIKLFGCSFNKERIHNLCNTKIIPNIPHTSIFTEFSLVFMQIKKKIQLIYLLKLIMLFYVILFSKSADS